MFEGIKISGLTKAEVETTEKALRAKIGRRQYRIEGPSFRRTEAEWVEAELPVHLATVVCDGDEYYCLMDSDGNNLSADPYEEFGWRETPKQAIQSAEENHPGRLDMETGTFVAWTIVAESKEIDGTGHFTVTYMGGDDSSMFDPGYCGSDVD